MQAENITTGQILDAEQTRQKIRRLAFEIYEENFDEKTIVLAGIEGMGVLLAKELAKALHEISNLEIVQICVSLDKLQPTQSDVTLDCDSAVFENKSIVLIDDVLNTGRTMVYSLRPFLKVRIKALHTAVLIDRGHHSFPIAADFAGFRLSTTLQEHIEVILDNDKKYGVYLH
ncbi:phosphoribosyltransferase family protein [Bernardetia sp.]|uniref:phosphoribosyltransferase family protein n=1 Tax=Bernardetia sp. TaxID=1937974 RepID=UPI0025B9A8BC|nr:phosphoribosyltransferase family protein [Bernardetia sp.]